MRTQTLYRAFLRCYPAAFRDEYGAQMLLVFAEQLGEARRRGSRLQGAALWFRAAVDALTVAPREHLHVIRQDLRYAWRSFSARPGFAIVAILSLALGIGANTAIFSLWNGVLHAPLPGVHEPEGLFMLSDPGRSGSWTGRFDGPRAWLTYGEFLDLREKAPAFSALMASESRLETFRVRLDGGDWEEARGRLVSGAFFEVLGVRPALGRLFTSGDDGADTLSAVVSHDYWQRRLGGRPDVLGSTIVLRKATLTISGVAPAGFIGETSAQRPDLWLPLRAQPLVLPGRDRLHDTPPEKAMWLHVFGRLAPGVTPPQAEAQANAVFQAGLESFYGAALQGERRAQFLDQRLQIRSAAGGASYARPAFARSLNALLAGVAVLLLIAYANLANLLLARGASRKAEIALRLSLGASRGRLVRQLVTESLVLAAAGGLAAFSVAHALHGVLVRMVAAADSRFDMSFVLEPRVMGFAAALSLLAALVFGVLPAWHVTRAEALDSLKDGSRGAVGSPGQVRSSRLLVGLQLALALPLLVGAGLLVRTVRNLQRAEMGFAADRLLLVRVDLAESAPDESRRRELRGQLLAEIQRVPGVTAASYSQLGLFTGGESSATVEVEGYRAAGADDRESGLDRVGPGYFSALGVPIMRGREIGEDDRETSPRVCVVNEAFARQFFAGRNPLGMRITARDDDGGRIDHEVVGVAGDARIQGVRDAVAPRFFIAARQPPAVSNSPTFLIRSASTGAAPPTLAAVRNAIERVNPSSPIVSARSIEAQLAPLLAQDRATARLVVGFGGVALALAAIGLYGVLSHGVALRTAEIAVRIALGARPGKVVTMILRETSRVVGAGLLIGGALAYAAARLLDSRLYGVAPQDPFTLASAIALLVIVALAAAWLPARRASRLDPITALRQQ
jgi:predicted permease